MTEKMPSRRGFRSCTALMPATMEKGKSLAARGAALLHDACPINQPDQEPATATGIGRRAWTERPTLDE